MTSSPYPHFTSVADKILTVLMYALAAGVAPWILTFPPVSYEGLGLVASVGWGILVGVGAVLMLAGELKRSHYVELPGVMLMGAGLLTYAMLSWEQTLGTSPGSGASLLAGFDEVVVRSLEQLRVTNEGTLLEPRGVGRAQLPSTVLGLLFHAAEHAQRHVGQVVTTVKIISGA